MTIDSTSPSFSAESNIFLTLLSICLYACILVKSFKSFLYLGMLTCIKYLQDRLPADVIAVWLNNSLIFLLIHSSDCFCINGPPILEITLARPLLCFRSELEQFTITSALQLLMSYEPIVIDYFLLTLIWYY
jgi:hypothetical protein